MDAQPTWIQNWPAHTQVMLWLCYTESCDMIFVGIDPSLSGTAVVVILSDGTAHSKRFSTAGHRHDSLSERNRRLCKITGWVIDYISEFVGDEQGSVEIAIEGPAYAQTNGSHHDRSGLWWILVDELHKVYGEGHVIDIPPTSLKKYATGKGNANKDEVLLSVARRYSTAPTIFTGQSNDEADAFVLAAIAARMNNTPIDEGLPVVQVDTLKKMMENK